MATFDPTKVVMELTIGSNTITVNGWAPDSSLEMDVDHEATTVTTGPDGLAQFSATGNQGGEVAFSLQYSSQAGLDIEKAILERDAEATREYIEGSVKDGETGRAYTLDGGEVRTYPRGISFSGNEAQPRNYLFYFQTITPNLDTAEGVSPPGGGEPSSRGSEDPLA